MRNAIGWLIILLFALGSLASFILLLIIGIGHIIYSFQNTSFLFAIRGLLEILVSGPASWLIALLGSFIGIEIQK